MAKSSRLIVFGALFLVATGCDVPQRVSRLEKQTRELQATADYDLQAKCSRDSKAWFKENWGTGGDDTILLTYTNHYNKGENKCFILLDYRYSFGVNGSWYNVLSLTDVYENSTRAEFSERHVVLTKPEYRVDDKKVGCAVWGKVCKDEDEFKELVRPHMND